MVERCYPEPWMLRVFEPAASIELTLIGCHIEVTYTEVPGPAECVARITSDFRSPCFLFPLPEDGAREKEFLAFASRQRILRDRPAELP